MNIKVWLAVSLLFLSVVAGLEEGENGWLFAVNKGGEQHIYVSTERTTENLFPSLIGADVADLKVQFNPSMYSYYSLENSENGLLTEEWIQSIAKLVSSVLHRTSRTLLVTVEKENEGAFLGNLPSDVSITVVSPRPYESEAPAHPETSFLTKLASTLLMPNDVIQGLVDQVNEADLRSFVEYLSGELSGSPLYTRNSVSEDAVEASEWIAGQFSQFKLKASTQCYSPLYSCNVIGVLTGSTLPNEVVVLGAHYDSRASNVSSPTQRAPGANDDGSGTGTLLQIAKILSRSNVQFARTIHFVAFSGEEQGLLGSQAYASLMVSTKTKVVAMIQNDMIAYRAPKAGLLCGFPLRYTTPSLTDIAISATNLYSPTVTTGRNDRCCSDHRSFYDRGFPSTDFSDTLGPIVDPEYHKSGDLVNRPGFDFPQYTGIVKGYFATAAVVAQVV